MTVEDYYNKVTNDMRKPLILENDMGVDTSVTEERLNSIIFGKMTGAEGFEYIDSLGGKYLLKLATTSSGLKPSLQTEIAACNSFAKFIFNY